MLRVLLLLLVAVCGSGVHGKRVEVLVDWRDAASKSAQEALGGISRTVSADDSILFLFPSVIRTPTQPAGNRRIGNKECDCAGNTHNARYHDWPYRVAFTSKIYLLLLPFLPFAPSPPAS